MIQGHTGDSRGVLQCWYEAISAAGRFRGWLVEFNPGEATGARGPADPEPVSGHVEVDSEDAIAVYARELEERVLSFLDRCGTAPACSRDPIFVGDDLDENLGPRGQAESPGCFQCAPP